METVLLACTFVAFALTVTGAPTYTTSEEEQIQREYPEDYQYQRETRSHYAPQYGLPCAAAAAATSQLHALPAPYHLNTPGYGVPQYGYGVPHYRSVAEQLAEPEMLAFSDMDQLQHQRVLMDHIPMARNGYGSLALSGPVLTSTGGSAYGIFPNANGGGCNIPLLFSCSPSISSGHMAESQGHYAPVGGPIAGANSYRLVEDNRHHVLPEQSEELVGQHLEPVHGTSHTQAHS